MGNYRITNLANPNVSEVVIVKSYIQAERDVYEIVYRMTGNHDFAADVSSWATDAPYGDYREENGILIEIEEDK